MLQRFQFQNDAGRQAKGTRRKLKHRGMPDMASNPLRSTVDIIARDAHAASLL
jgi:hypothetical protein